MTLDFALMLRITTKDKASLDALAAAYSLKVANVARIAMRLGVAQIRDVGGSALARGNATTLHVQHSCSSVPPTGMSEQDDQRKADWLRKVSGLSAQWDPNGNLTALTLDKLQAESIPETQPSIVSPQKREKAERDQRRAIALRSSGGPVPRLDAED
jgi:hypothetical protein